MINFPTTCIDNFYNDPDAIRRFALSLPYEKDDEGRWPGKRTKNLHTIDAEFFINFSKKLGSIFYVLEKTDIQFSIETCFQLIDPYSKDQRSPKNIGWIHYDIGVIFAGVIFLTPNIDKTCGTSLYRILPNPILDKSNVKTNFYSKNLDEDYDHKILIHNSNFEETVKFANIYNRMICFDGKIPHKANNFFSKNFNSRLTQVFFVKNVVGQDSTPIQRQKVFL
jgi:hypothetical protein